MIYPADIQFIQRKQLDVDKWNNCIDKSANGLIYGYSWYLDHMAKQWDGLVLNDYETVMPVTWNRKYGIAYLYQPFLAAQLGIFGNDITAEIVEVFLSAIPSRFRYWDIYLNHKNVFALEKYQLYQRRNFVLDLSPGYEQLYAGYRDNIKRNVKKAFKLGCSVIRDFSSQQVVQLAKEQMHTAVKDAGENMDRFLALYAELEQKKQARTYGIVSGRGELIASCIFIFSHNRAYYILVGNHPDGRTVGASHALIDAFIKDHAGQPLLLDFEGSDIRNLAFFYSSFGAREESYGAIRLNKLPAYLKWLKT